MYVYIYIYIYMHDSVGYMCTAPASMTSGALAAGTSPAGRYSATRRPVVTRRPQWPVRLVGDPSVPNIYRKPGRFAPKCKGFYRKFGPKQ